MNGCDKRTQKHTNKVLRYKCSPCFLQPTPQENEKTTSVNFTYKVQDVSLPAQRQYMITEYFQVSGSKPLSSAKLRDLSKCLKSTW